MDSKAKISLVESSVVKLHASLKAKDETIEALNNKVEMLTAEVNSIIVSCALMKQHSPFNNVYF